MNKFRATPNIEKIKAHKNQAFSIYAPMNFIVVYVIFTLVLYLVGPWDYKDRTLWPVIGYMTVAMLFFIFGYRSVASRFSKKVYRDEPICKNNYRRLISIAKIGLVIQLIFTILLAITDYTEGRLSIQGLFNPGQAYINALEFSKDSDKISFIGQIKTIFSPFIYFSNIFLLFNYSRIGVRWRLILVFALGLQLAHGALIKAAQKGFFDLLILFTSVGILRAYFDRVRFLNLIKYSLFFLFSVLAVFAFFQLSRMNAYDALDYSGVERMSLDRNGLLFAILGDSLGLAVSLFISYISMGYYGLSLCLQLPFEWTYGLGNSFALTSYAEQYIGLNSIADNTYPARMDAYFGWPAKMYWHSIFPWIASDLTFFGAIIFMYLIGRGYAKSFIDSVAFESPLGICTFYFLSTLLIYIPANNQIMQTREMMIGSSILILTWVIFGRKYRKKLH